LTAIEPVRKLLEDPDPHIRYDTIRTINAIVSRETRSRAQKLYEEAQSEPARFDAAILLCELGDPSQYRHVLPSLEDQANPAFYQALSVVTMFAKYQLFHKGRPVDWVGPISRVLLSRELHPMARADAVIALVEIGSPEALAAMRQALLSATDPSIKARLQAAVDRKD
jgi:HEAT repeat protein